MMDILLIAHFCNDFDGKGNNRFNYLANLLTTYQCNVELVTTDFSHSKKKKRDSIETNLPYKVTMISEPGYNKNVSFRRFYSHKIMGKNIKKYFKVRKKPDVIYCAVPSLDVAKEAAKYAMKNNIRFIIDVQDLWPEAFKMVFNLPVISDIIFFPMKKTADYIYSTADEIIAVSKTYVDRVISVNKKCGVGYDVFLGTELSNFDKLAYENRISDKPEDEFWLAYIGTLGHSYDLFCVIDALKCIMDMGISNVKFIIMGDGPLRDKFESYAKEKGINSIFTGRLEYGKMVGILSVCDIAVNPIKRGSAGSIINKVGDYAAAGLPVINTQESPEYRTLVDEYEIGLNCENNNALDMADKILLLYNNKKLKKAMKINSRKIALEKFDRLKTYKEIVELLVEVEGER